MEGGIYTAMYSRMLRTYNFPEYTSQRKGSEWDRHIWKAVDYMEPGNYMSIPLRSKYQVLFWIYSMMESENAHIYLNTAFLKK